MSEQTPRSLSETQYALLRAECDIMAQRRVEDMAKQIIARLDASNNQGSTEMKELELRVRASEDWIRETRASLRTAHWIYGSLLAIVGTSVGIVALIK